KTKVAVIDSGFDLKENLSNMSNPNFALKPGFKDAIITNDHDGHGTSVAALIGAKNGIGLAPNSQLTVYGITRPGNELGTASRGQLKLSIERACNEGQEVINVSYGAGNEYIDVRLFEPFGGDLEFTTMLAKKGCLVVNAAGNAGTREKNILASKIEDPVLRVESATVTNFHDSSSSLGVITAPGAGVFTLKSSTKIEKKSDALTEKEGRKNTCGTNKGAFISGTSFAAPITAAIATNISDVLKTSKNYDKYSGPERIKLVNYILYASQKENVINGLRAVLIAERWVKETNQIKVESKGFLEKSLSYLNNKKREILKLGPLQDQTSPNLDYFSHLLDRSPDDICNRLTTCSNVLECKNLSICKDQLRKQVAICSPVNPKVITELIGLGNDYDNQEMVLKYTPALIKSKENLSEEAKKSIQKIWRNYKVLWQGNQESKYPEIQLRFGMDSNIAIELYPLFVRSLKESKKGTQELEQSFYDVFSSYELDGALTNEYMNNRDEYRTRVKKALDEILQNFGSAKMLELLRKQESSSQNTDSLKWILETLIADPKYKSIQTSLQLLQKKK
ncbi:MAG: S8/S53 family peptidase, partial [Bacteriovorax sp.]|nr:S8/S53 family peptidase [Bacteriovorax sp.]